jgi:hypothetical protein
MSERAADRPWSLKGFAGRRERERHWAHAPLQRLFPRADELGVFLGSFPPWTVVWPRMVPAPALVPAYLHRSLEGRIGRVRFRSWWRMR